MRRNLTVPIPVAAALRGSSALSKYFAIPFMVGPTLLILVAFFLMPLLYMVVYSFYRYDPLFIVQRIFTLENYAKFVSDEYIREITFRTFRVALITTFLTLVLGFPVALRMTRASGLEKFILVMIVLLPMTISHVILGYAWLVLIGPTSGVLSILAGSLGILSGPLNLMYTERGIILGLTHYTLAYMVLNLHAALETVDDGHLRAASILGATPIQVFQRVTLPLSLPGIFSGSLLTFALSSSAFMIPFQLGGKQVPVLTVYVYDLNTSILNWPQGAAAGLVLLLISVTTIFVFGAYVSRLGARLRMGVG